MEKRYELKKGWKFFVYFFAIVFIVAGILTAYFAFQNDGQKVFFFFLGLSIFLFGLYSLIGMYNTYLLVDNSGITYCGGLFTRRLLFSEIDGFRFDGRSPYVIPIHNSKKRIFIQDINYFADVPKLVAWLKDTVTDKNLVEQLFETVDIFFDHRVGVTGEQRLARLKKASRIVWGLGAIAVILDIVTIYFLQISTWLILLTMAIPVVCFVARDRYKGIVKFYGNENGVHPLIGLPVSLSGFGLALKTGLFYSIYDYGKLWIIVGCVAAALFTLVFLLIRSEIGGTHKYDGVFMIFLFSVPMAFGVVTATNCYKDTSKPTFKKAMVTEKDIKSEKMIIRHQLTLSAWGNNDAGEEETVSDFTYDQVNKGDSVRVVLKKGVLNIPWYYITEK